MEAFSLLKYWKGGGAGGGDDGDLSSTTRCSSSTTKTIVTAVSNADTDTEDDDDESDGDDDGPFFDLEFTVPDEEVEVAEGEGEKSVKQENAGGSVVQVIQEEVEGEENDDVEANAAADGGSAELKFTLSSGSSSCGRTADLNLSLSPSDDLFLKGRLLPIDDPSEVMNSKSSSQLAVSLLKSATRLRVLMSGLKKSKLQQSQPQPTPEKQIGPSEKNQQQPQEKKQNQNDNSSSSSSSKLLTAKFKIEEAPIVSLFTRDNSSRASNVENSSNKQPTPPQQQKQSGEEESAPSSHSKDGMQKYLKKVKPLYIRVSKRYGDKLRFAGQLSLSSVSKTTAAAFAKGEGEAAEVKEEAAVAEVGGGGGGGGGDDDGRSQNHKQGNLAVGFRVMCKHLGKSKSASSVVHSMPMQSRRCDDSLLQQQDGIQSAILHCKRSFNGCRETESSVFSRSSSDPSHDKSTDLSTRNASAVGEGDDVVADVPGENAPQQA